MDPLCGRLGGTSWAKRLGVERRGNVRGEFGVGVRHLQGETPDIEELAGVEDAATCDVPERPGKLAHDGDDGGALALAQRSAPQPRYQVATTGSKLSMRSEAR